MAPTLAEHRYDLISQRAHFKKVLRNLLDQKGLLEVDVPLLGDEACPDPSSLPISFEYQKQRLHLAPSPEYFMKRLLAQAPGDYYSLGPCFRSDPLSKYHNPEFLMLEFYLMGDKFEHMKTLTAQVIRLFRSFPQIEQMTYNQVFELYIQVTPNGNKKNYLDKLIDSQIDFDLSWSAEVLEDLLFSAFCQEHLGKNKLTLITDFPEHHSALAQFCPKTKTAQRVEFFLEGVEVANGYSECLCPEENKKRIAQWEKQWSCSAPQSEKFIQSLEHIPPCSGVAIGFDRLVQLALNKKEISDAVLFAWQFKDQKVII